MSKLNKHIVPFVPLVHCTRSTRSTNGHRYTLQPYTGRNSRYTCPNCHRPHDFSRYIDTETGEALADNVGKCNHIGGCGYHYTPKQYFADTGTKPTTINITYKPKPETPKPVSYISDEVFNQSLKGYETNSLIKYLHFIFDTDTITNLINLYKIGTSSRYGGGTTVFWQIDNNDKVRAGKLIKYAENGHRVHGKQNWVHSVLNIDNFNLKQCLFGEHILKHAPDAIVAIVESEKTAVIASAFLPEMVWLATGGADNLNKEKVKILKSRKVVLFPDASKDGRIYDKWKQKADKFGLDISDLLEKEATPEQKAAGVDIADFLIKQDAGELAKTGGVGGRHSNIPGSNIGLKTLPDIGVTLKESSTSKNLANLTEKPKDWNEEISALEAYFAQTKLPAAPVKLNDWTTIIDTPLFVDSHLSIVKQHNGNRTFLPYLNRLLKLKEIVTINLN